MDMSVWRALTPRPTRGCGRGRGLAGAGGGLDSDCLPRLSSWRETQFSKAKKACDYCKNLADRWHEKDAAEILREWESSP